MADAARYIGFARLRRCSVYFAPSCFQSASKNALPDAVEATQSPALPPFPSENVYVASRISSWKSAS